MSATLRSIEVGQRVSNGGFQQGMAPGGLAAGVRRVLLEFRRARQMVRSEQGEGRRFRL